MDSEDLKSMMLAGLERNGHGDALKKEAPVETDQDLAVWHLSQAIYHLTIARQMAHEGGAKQASGFIDVCLSGIDGRAGMSAAQMLTMETALDYIQKKL